MSATARQRRYQERERTILAIARRVAEEEGWPAVTTRRLAQEIDHSQPVIYQHFGSREGLVDALALEGFRELTALVHAITDRNGQAPLEDLGRGYLEFGTGNPAVYEAMFNRPTSLRFAQDDTPAELRTAFETLAATVARETKTTDKNEVAARTELFWAACHGITTLHVAGRIPSDHLAAHIRRIALMVQAEATAWAATVRPEGLEPPTLSV